MNPNQGYENAPATRLLATHCLICGRPLVDANSVSLGIGPECSGHVQVIPNNARQQANKFIYDAAIAAQTGNIQEVLKIAQLIRDLAQQDPTNEQAFISLGDKVATRFVSAEKNATILIIVAPDKYNKPALHVTTPYRRGDSEAFKNAWRQIPGRYWDFDNSINVIPLSQKRVLWDLLCQFFPGHFGKADGNLFRVPPKPIQQTP